MAAQTSEWYLGGKTAKLTLCSQKYFFQKTLFTCRINKAVVPPGGNEKSLSNLVFGLKMAKFNNLALRFESVNQFHFGCGSKLKKEKKILKENLQSRLYLSVQAFKQNLSRGDKTTRAMD